MTHPIPLQFEQASRCFAHDGSEPRFALRDVTVTLARGETAAVVGRSGSGKSTLLHLAAAIDQPTSGRVSILGRDPTRLSERERTLLRRDEIGLVFQFFHLLSHLTVVENILLPHWIGGSSGRDIDQQASHLLDRVGLADRADEPIDRLSGGEKQRVAICRALIRKPSLILADEPTGSLDDESGRQVMDLLLEMVAEGNASLLFVTHSDEVAARADTLWRLSSGELVQS